MTETTWTPGKVVWREAMTTDIERAKGFYGELFGWTYSVMPMGDGSTYTMIKAGERFIGGIAPKPADAPGPAHWLSYVSVPNVDESVAGAKAHGGTVLMPAFDVPEVGRMAIVADAAGAALAVIRATKGDGPAPERPGTGEFCWETLTTPDTEKAKAYYAAYVGWKPVAGPVPGMLVFGASPEAPVADVQPSNDVPSNWMTYVVVENRDAARDRAAKLGAQVIVPSIDIPNVGLIAVVADPNGAVLGLFQAQM